MWAWFRSWKRFFEAGEVAERAAAVHAPSILKAARRLQFRLAPERVSELAGAYHAARPGAGLAFQELRPYEPGDDVRHIDWKVTARQNRPYVRRYVEERSLRVRLVVDVSASMRFGPTGASKADRAAQAAALLGAAAIQNGDLVSLCLVSDRVESELAAATGSRHLSAILRALVLARSSSRETNLTAAMEPQGRRRRKGLVVLLSDFQAAGPAMPWRKCSGGSGILAIRVVEPLEERLPEAGLLRLAGLESGRGMVVDSSSRRVRTGYAQAASERHLAFRAWCAEARATGLDLRTDLEPARVLMGHFRNRGKSSRGRR